MTTPTQVAAIIPTDTDTCECCEQRLARWHVKYDDGGSFQVCAACYADNATPWTEAPSRLY